MGTVIVAGEAREVPFRTRQAIGLVPTKQRVHAIRQIILHHDVCLSADACARVLAARGLSTHFCVDNDGTVVQLADTNGLCFHACGEIKDDAGVVWRNKSFNHRSIGIDISNAVLPQYASRYKPPRIEQTVTIHGVPVCGLMPYECQIDACLALVKFLCGVYNIPLTTRTSLEWLGDLRSWTPGVYGHLHIARGKIDPFGFPFERLTEAT